jgi:hypothetical protein
MMKVVVHSVECWDEVASWLHGFWIGVDLARQHGMILLNEHINLLIWTDSKISFGFVS